MFFEFREPINFLLRASPPCWAVPGGAGELLQERSSQYALTWRKSFPLERMSLRGAQQGAFPRPRALPAWSEDVVAEPSPCQAVGELPGLATASFLTCRSWFPKACAWSCSAEEDLLAVDENKKCHCCSVWGQEKAGWLITSAGHFFLLQGIICF